MKGCKGVLRKVTFLYFTQIFKMMTLVYCSKLFKYNIMPREITKKPYRDILKNTVYESKLFYNKFFTNP